MRSFIVMAYFTIVGISAINFIAAQVSAVKFTVSVPEFSSQMNDRVYLTGSFNGWRPNDSLYIMNRENKTIYSLLVPLFDGKRYEYKYTRGGWSSVEININDSDIANRQLYSRNGLVLNDTVLKWKVPPIPQSKTLSPQMQKLVAMRDSAKTHLQLTLNKLLVLLKQYNEIMLSPKPNERKHKKLNKQTIELIANLYETIESKIWEIGTSLSPGQKQKILAAIRSPNGSKDLLTTLGNAYGDALR